MGFDGYAHGGLGLGEAASTRTELVAEAQAALPPRAPRYLMGLGRPEDLVAGVALGVDLFDCVVPTRHARHGLLFTSRGSLAIRNARFAGDGDPVDPACDCPTCRGHARGYLRHLFQVGDALGPRLATLHNLRFYLGLMERARRAISAGAFAALRTEVEQAARERVA
jgi:queuine tRNA-ribosyltransferase